MGYTETQRYLRRTEALEVKLEQVKHSLERGTTIFPSDVLSLVNKLNDHCNEIAIFNNFPINLPDNALLLARAAAKANVAPNSQNRETFLQLKTNALLALTCADLENQSEKATKERRIKLLDISMSFRPLLWKFA